MICPFCGSWVKKETFLFDLYYRINVINIEVPPLRERTDDIPLLALHFLNKLLEDKRKLKFSYEAVTKLKSYHWPGNVRELENVIRRSIVLTPKDSEFMEVII